MPPPPPNPATPLPSPPRLLGTAASPELGGTAVDDDVAARLAYELARNSTCLTLDLCGQRVGDSGAAALAAALERNTSLIRLDLALNRIGAAGANALLNALETNKTLASLDLSGNDAVDAPLLAAVANRLEANELSDAPSPPSGRPPARHDHPQLQLGEPGQLGQLASAPSGGEIPRARARPAPQDARK